jgi:L-ribulose-5-phosphate 4-epimerase
MNEEGVIKFHCYWTEAAALDDAVIKKLNLWRDRLFAAGLMGMTDDGIGYGNISSRLDETSFIITGSGTGRLEKLSAAHYVTVTGYDLEQNRVTAKGPLRPSSESLTHAAIYSQAKQVKAVFHVHHHALWNQLLHAAPSTARDVPYGTPQMAKEVMRLISESSVRLFAMAGHEDGIIAFGETEEEAGKRLMEAIAGLG